MCEIFFFFITELSRDYKYCSSQKLKGRKNDGIRQRFVIVVACRDVLYHGSITIQSMNLKTTLSKTWIGSIEDLFVRTRYI